MEHFLKIGISLKIEHFLENRIFIFLNVHNGRFDISGSMIPRLVPEILPCAGFCDKEEEEELELGILVG